VLVTSAAPVDQYLARDPRWILGAPIEEARIDPNNVELLLQHLRCAAFELPFAAKESFGELSADATARRARGARRGGLLHAEPRPLDLDRHRLPRAAGLAALHQGCTTWS
jgi:DEAD/DEAH box helicase domain-containing protein